MASFLYFLLHTSIMCLAHLFPKLIGLFLIISVVIVSYVWFRRSSRFLFNVRFYRGLLILPLLALAVIATRSNIGFFVLWLLYVIVIFINYVVPISKFLILRLRIYIRVKRLVKTKGYRSNISLLRIIFSGSHTPYVTYIQTPEKNTAIGVLGAVSASRYIFGRTTIVSQKFGNGKAYMIEDIAMIEKFEQDMDYLFPRIGPSFLGSKYKCDLPSIEDIDEVLLILHPNSYIQENEKIIGMGERIGKYLLVSVKTAFAIL